MGSITAAGRFEDARADVQEGGAVLLEQLGDRDRFVETPASFDPFLARVANADGKIAAALALDARDDFEHEPHAIGEAPAEAVVAPVDVRAHELSQQIAVRGVEFHASKPACWTRHAASANFSASS